MIIIEICYFANGERYDGEFLKGKFSGKGKHKKLYVGSYYYANGNKYEGDWNNDVREGGGKLNN